MYGCDAITQTPTDSLLTDVCLCLGVLDAEDSLVERSDEFFNDLCTFRSINKDQCVHSLETG